METEKTIGFSESDNLSEPRWTSYYTYEPEMVLGLNNAFYSFKNGDLYEHDLGPVNTFYGEQNPSKIIVVFNDAPGDDKVFHGLNIEGTDPWDMTLKTNQTQSTLQNQEFVSKESRWFAYTRRDENALDFKSLGTVGIGIISSVTGLNIEFAIVNARVSIGDVLYQIINNEPQQIGVIDSINSSTITVNVQDNIPVVSSYAFALKNSRLEGSVMRGYYMEVEMTFDKDKETEIFAINSTVSKSYV